MIRYAIIFLIIILCACSKTETPSTRIGEGVEIYKVALSWRDTTVEKKWRISGVKYLSDTPVARYDDILNYKREYKEDFKEKVIYFTFNKSGRKIITGHPWATKPDTGFAVTLNKELIYAGYYKSGGAAYHERDVYFWDYTTSLPDNASLVEWDSIIGGKRRNEFDTRYDKRLLERLRKDGKLIGFD